MVQPNSLESRVEALEKAVLRLQQEKEQRQRDLRVAAGAVDNSWIDKVAGTFADDPDFDEATRIGREYRQSFQPKDESDAA